MYLCVCFCFKNTSIVPTIFLFNDGITQQFQIHPIQRRAAEIRLHIRHGQDAPIAVCGLVCEVVFEQRSCYTERNLWRCHFRKPLFLFVCQSDGFCPKRTKLQCIGNHIIKTKDQVTFRAFREDRDLKLNDLFPPRVFEFSMLSASLCVVLPTLSRLLWMKSTMPRR